MKYQIFGSTTLNKISKDATSFDDLKNGMFYQIFSEKFNSIKAAQKRASEILRKGEFKMINCDQFTQFGLKPIFKRFAQDLKTNQ
jgi:hypothetical protein